MTANATLQSDIQEYLTASKNYSEVCKKSELDRAIAIQLRDARRDLFASKTTAAENIIMSMIGENAPALARAGLFSFYEELAAGKHSSGILFKIADETSKAFS